MGKSVKTNRKKYEIKLSLPDQKHLSYLSDGHAISNSSRLAKGETFQNFEGYLLDSIFKQANQDIGQYTAYLKAKQQEQKEKADAISNKESTEENTNASNSGSTEPKTNSTEE